MATNKPPTWLRDYNKIRILLISRYVVVFTRPCLYKSVSNREIVKLCYLNLIAHFMQSLREMHRNNLSLRYCQQYFYQD